jgi:hypothetical protein
MRSKLYSKKEMVDINFRDIGVDIGDEMGGPCITNGGEEERV